MIAKKTPPKTETVKPISQDEQIALDKIEYEKAREAKRAAAQIANHSPGV